MHGGYRPVAIDLIGFWDRPPRSTPGRPGRVELPYNVPFRHILPTSVIYATSNIDVRRGNAPGLTSIPHPRQARCQRDGFLSVALRKGARRFLAR